ncbi:MAG: uracil-xanthine permease family protein [Parabacteroides sp.]
MSNIYKLDGRVPLQQALPFGLQHILAMFVANITPIIILCGVAGIDKGISASLIQNCMVIAGIGTLVQLYPIWRIGSRLPIVMGISFTFLSLAIVIATTQGMGTLMGAIIIGGLVEGCLGLFPDKWTRLVPPAVAATVVAAIGFSLLPIGANSFAGGQGAADFGSVNNWIVGSVTLLTCIITLIIGKGMVRSLSILIGLIVGYITALCMGMVSFDTVREVPVASLPTLMPFTLEFHVDAILAIICIFLVSATETIGDTSALCSGALGRDVTTQEMGASVACDGFVSSISGLFGCTPITSFSQNVGLAAISKVINRYTIATGAVILIICGLFPPIGALLATIPQCVLGGCTIMMFGSIVFASFGMMARCGFSQRNMIITSLSLSIGLGFTSAPEMFNIFPDIVHTVFAQNCVAVVFLIAVLLNVLLPKEIKENE